MFIRLPVLVSLASLAGSACAKIAAGSGDFAITINGVTSNPALGKDFKVSNAPCKGVIAVRGVHVGFDVNCANLGVYNYTLTGAADAQRLVTSPTIVFTAKVATLTPAQLASPTIKDLQLQDDTIVVTFTTAAGKLKLQVKDGAQGGLFQMETEFASNVEFVHVLGPTLFYFVNTVTGKINFGNGIDADSTHKMLIGKDSPQVATKTFQSGSTTKWDVAPGGRLGGVLGEDGTELGAGATNCTSQCQAQNRINGSIPPTQDPVDPVPIGGK